MGRLRPCQAGLGIVSELETELTIDMLASGKSESVNTPQWSFSQDESRPVGEQLQCVIEFEVPYDLSRSGSERADSSPGRLFVLQAHQLVRGCAVKLTVATKTTVVTCSLSTRLSLRETTAQCKFGTGNANGRSDIDGGNCKPVTSFEGKPYYPCGLIANSVFNGG